MNTQNDMETPNTNQAENVENGVNEAENVSFAAEETSQEPVDEVSVLKQKLEEADKKYLYLMADFQNLRQRSAKEKIELTVNGSKNLIVDLLPVLDNFELALKNMDQATDVTAVKEGVKINFQQYHNILKGKGLQAIEAKGLPFNVDEHEAITTFPAPSDDLKNTVIDVIQPGYKLNDQIIRFAKVVVAE
jgi:molecular chaperone GrpE